MKCDGCTLCCKLLSVPWMCSPPGEMCKDVIEGEGCAIFDSVPVKCLKYRCAYHQMDNAGIELRPDKCGVIFEKLTEDIFIALSDDTDVLLNIVKRQIDSLTREGFSVALCKVNKIPIIYLCKGKKEEDIFLILKEKYHDRSELHS